MLSDVARTLLIVDDHAGFRSSARRLLEAEGFEVVGEAADGRGALEATARLRPGVVLLDVGLPDRDGFSVAADLAAGAGAPQVVLTSGRSAEELAPLVGASAARGFVAKDDLSGAALGALLA
jgi:DNA-binding NarL/FixJ family response regulator